MTTSNATTGETATGPAAARRLGFWPMLAICAAIGAGLVFTMDSFGNDYAYLAAYTVLFAWSAFMVAVGLPRRFRSITAHAPGHTR